MMRGEQVYSANSQRFLQLLLAIAFAGGASACAILQPVPERVSSARESQTTVQIQDPVRYRQALDLVNQGNRSFVRQDFGAALQFAEQSLAKHENYQAYYLRGIAYQRLGKLDESLAALREAERLAGGDEQVLLTLATVLIARGETEQAQQRYLRLMELYPQEPLYPYRAGVTYKNMRQYERAYEFLLKADQPNFQFRDQLYLQLGDVCLELKRYDESRQFFQKAAQANPQLADAARGGQATQTAQLLEQGNRALAARNYEEALSSYRAAREQAPDQAAPYLLSGTALLALERPQEATADLLKALELNPRDAKTYSLLGAAYQKQRRYREALETLERGIQVAPDSADLFNKIGLVRRDREETRAAIDSFNRALQVQSDYQPARINLAFTLLDDHRYSDARREFEAALRQDPNNEELKRGLGLIDVYTILDRGNRHFQDNRLPEALNEYRRARQLRADLPIVHNAIGQAELARRDGRAAESSYRESLKLDANGVAALQGLARALALQRRTRESNEIIARLGALTRNDAGAALAIGRIREDQNDLAGAERHYQEFLRRNPDAIPVQRRLGLVYYRQALAANDREQYPAALRLFEKAQAANPEIPQLPAALATVRENIRYAALLPRLKSAEALFNRGEFERALPIYQEVYRDLKRPLIAVKISQCYIAMGQEQRAFQSLEQAEAENGAGNVAVEISEAIYNFALRRDEMDRAERGFGEIVERHPDAYYSWYKLGVIHLHRRQFSDAIADFDRSITFKPDFAPAYIARGVARYEGGDHDRARQEFEEAIQRDSEAVLASFNLGVYFYNASMIDRAEKIFRDLVQDFPEFPDARYQLSFILFQRGELPGAESELRAALERKDDDRYRWALAQVLDKRFQQSRNPGDGEAARSAYEDVIRRFPGSRFAGEARQRIMTLRPGERIVQAYAADASGRIVGLLRGALIVWRDRQILALDAASRRQLWVLRLDEKPRAVGADQTLVVLGVGQIALYDLSDGSLLNSFATPRESEQLYASGNRIAVLASPARRTAPSALKVYDSRGELLGAGLLPAGARLAAVSGHILRVERKGARAVVARLKFVSGLIQDDAIVEAPFERLRAAPLVSSQGEMLVLSNAGEQSIAINVREMAMTATIALPVGVEQARLQRGEPARWIVVQGQDIRVHGDGGRELRRVRLPTPPASAAAVELQGAESVIYVGRDGALRSIGSNGQEEWKTALPEERAAAYTLYY
ncbi:MAG: tetratricopeptide repeat protein [Leptospirales bacterium]|nr:tetratricopeptide repeat protein [Leptospirales bacterium]